MHNWRAADIGTTKFDWKLTFSSCMMATPKEGVAVPTTSMIGRQWDEGINAIE